MSGKTVGYTYWSNERFIAEEGQFGVMHGRVFSTKDAADRYYKLHLRNRLHDEDVCVKVTVEIAK